MREGACGFAGRDASARVSLRGRADAAPARESSFHGWARRASARGRGRCELAQEPPRCSALRPIAHSRASRRLDNRSDSTRHGRPGERCKLLHGKLRIATLPLVIKGQKAGAEERDEHVEVRPQVLRQPQRVALWSVSAARSTRRIPSAQPSAAPPASRAPSSTPCDASSSSPSTSGLPPRAGKKMPATITVAGILQGRHKPAAPTLYLTSQLPWSCWRSASITLFFTLTRTDSQNPMGTRWDIEVHRTISPARSETSDAK